MLLWVELSGLNYNLRIPSNKSGAVPSQMLLVSWLPLVETRYDLNSGHDCTDVDNFLNIHVGELSFVENYLLGVTRAPCFASSPPYSCPNVRFLLASYLGKAPVGGRGASTTGGVSTLPLTESILCCWVLLTAPITER